MEKPILKTSQWIEDTPPFGQEQLRTDAQPERLSEPTRFDDSREFVTQFIVSLGDDVLTDEARLKGSMNAMLQQVFRGSPAWRRALGKKQDAMTGKEMFDRLSSWAMGDDDAIKSDELREFEAADDAGKDAIIARGDTPYFTGKLREIKENEARGEGAGPLAQTISTEMIESGEAEGVRPLPQGVMLPADIAAKRKDMPKGKEFEEAKAEAEASMPDAFAEGNRAKLHETHRRKLEQQSLLHWMEKNSFRWLSNSTKDAVFAAVATGEMSNDTYDAIPEKERPTALAAIKALRGETAPFYFGRSTEVSERMQARAEEIAAKPASERTLAEHAQLVRHEAVRVAWGAAKLIPELVVDTGRALHDAGEMAVAEVAGGDTEKRLYADIARRHEIQAATTRELPDAVTGTGKILTGFGDNIGFAGVAAIGRMGEKAATRGVVSAIGMTAASATRREAAEQSAKGAFKFAGKRLAKAAEKKAAAETAEREASRAVRKQVGALRALDSAKAETAAAEKELRVAETAARGTMQPTGSLPSKATADNYAKALEKVEKATRKQNAIQVQVNGYAAGRESARAQAIWSDIVEAREKFAAAAKTLDRLASGTKNAARVAENAMWYAPFYARHVDHAVQDGIPLHVAMKSAFVSMLVCGKLEKATFTTAFNGSLSPQRMTAESWGAIRDKVLNAFASGFKWDASKEAGKLFAARMVSNLGHGLNTGVNVTAQSVADDLAVHIKDVYDRSADLHGMISREAFAEAFTPDAKWIETCCETLDRSVPAFFGFAMLSPAQMRYGSWRRTQSAREWNKSMYGEDADAGRPWENFSANMDEGLLAAASNLDRAVKTAKAYWANEAVTRKERANADLEAGPPTRQAAERIEKDNAEADKEMTAESLMDRTARTINAAFEVAINGDASARTVENLMRTANVDRTTAEVLLSVANDYALLHDSTREARAMYEAYQNELVFSSPELLRRAIASGTMPGVSDAKKVDDGVVFELDLGGGNKGRFGVVTDPQVTKDAMMNGTKADSAAGIDYDQLVDRASVGGSTAGLFMDANGKPARWAALTEDQRLEFLQRRMAGLSKRGGTVYRTNADGSRSEIAVDDLISLVKGNAKSFHLRHETAHSLYRMARDLGYITLDMERNFADVLGIDTKSAHARERIGDGGEERWRVEVDEAISDGYADFTTGISSPASPMLVNAFRKATEDIRSAKERGEKAPLFARAVNAIAEVVAPARPDWLRTETTTPASLDAVYRAMMIGDWGAMSDAAASLTEARVRHENERRELEARHREERAIARREIADRKRKEREEKRRLRAEAKEKQKLTYQQRAREQWLEAERRAKEEEEFWKELDAEVEQGRKEAEERELAEMEARHKAEFDAWYAQEEEREKEAEEAMKAAEERDRKYEETRKEEGSRDLPRLRHSKNQTAEEAQRSRKAYELMWMAMKGRGVSEADVEWLAEEYGLPPEAIGLKRRTSSGGKVSFVRSKTQTLSEESSARVQDDLVRFYADVASTRIMVPDVVVATSEEANRTMPNEVYDPVFGRFVTGRIVVDPNLAQSFREQAGLQDDANGGGDTRFSFVTPAQDAAYMDAVERGDTETAQRLADDAAKRAGYDRVAYHGTPFGGWSVFDKSRSGMVSGNGRGGLISLTSSQEEANAYSKADDASDISDVMRRVNRTLEKVPDKAWRATEGVIDGMDGEPFSFDPDAFMDYAEQFVNEPDEYDFSSRAEYNAAVKAAERSGYIEAMESVLADIRNAMPEQSKVIDEALSEIKDIREQRPEVKKLAMRIENPYEASATPETYGEVMAEAEKAIHSGRNDGAIVHLDNGTTRYLVKNESQIKSADAITRDDAGNVIPLSQRFNQERLDVRYSITKDATLPAQDAAYMDAVERGDIVNFDTLELQSQSGSDRLRAMDKKEARTNVDASSPSAFRHPQGKITEPDTSLISPRVAEAIALIDDEEFRKIYHGSKSDFDSSGTSVLFSDLPDGDDGAYDESQNIIYVNKKLFDDTNKIAGVLRHELTHVRQVREGENVPEGFDVHANDLSALKYLVDPGELEARYAEEGRLDEFARVVDAISSPMSDRMEDVEIGEMQIVDWRKNALSPTGIRQLQQASRTDRIARDILRRAGAEKTSDLLPAKLEEIGERIMSDDESAHVGTAIGYRVLNPAAYTQQTIKNGRIRLEVLGRKDTSTGKRKNINPVSIARKLSELGIKASAVGPNEINIFATPETMEKLGEVKEMMARTLPENGINGERNFDFIAPNHGVVNFDQERLDVRYSITKDATLPAEVLSPEDRKGVEEVGKSAYETGAATRYSVVAGLEGSGLSWRQDENGRLEISLPDGRRVDASHPATANDIMAIDSPLMHLVDLGLANGTLGRTAKEGRAIKRNIAETFAQCVNLVAKWGDTNEGVSAVDAMWRWTADETFKALKQNSDAQYGTSVDILTICKKTDMLMQIVSDYMKKQKRGAMPTDIMHLYLETGKSGFQTPCPVCYVFSRWIRAGYDRQTAYEAQRMYADAIREHDPNTEEGKSWWKAEYKRVQVTPDQKDRAAEISKAKETLTLGYQAFDRAMRNGDVELADRINQDIAAAFETIRTADLAGWIKYTIYDADRDIVWNDFKEVPSDILFDFRSAAVVAREYPALKRYYASKGSAGGKAIETEARNDLGDVVVGIAADGKPGTVNELKSAYAAPAGSAERKTALKAFDRKFKAALAKSIRQRIIGGQRFFSWSDNRVEFGFDMMMNLLQVQLLGDSVQSYSKQLEGAELLTRHGAYNNGSLMGSGNGLEGANPGEAGAVNIDGKWLKLKFSDIQGINHEELFKLNKALDKSGNILVGMNDDHIKVALRDERIFFVIPWHASGLGTGLLDYMLSALGEDAHGTETDYSSYQSEKFLSGATPGAEVKGVWDRAQAAGKKFRSCMKVEHGASVTESQLAYRALREAIIKGTATQEQVDLAMKDEFLSAVVRELQQGAKEIGGKDADGSYVNKALKVPTLKMTSAAADAIYPYEYWDRKSTYGTSAVNSARYLEYCRRLGVMPKFCGLSVSNGKAVRGTYGDFTNEANYWKLLIDRRMYANGRNADGSFRDFASGKYQHTDPVQAATEDRGFDVDTIDPDAVAKKWGKLITKPANEKQVGGIVDKVIEQQRKIGYSLAGTRYSVSYGAPYQGVDGERLSASDARNEISAMRASLSLPPEAAKRLSVDDLLALAASAELARTAHNNVTRQLAEARIARDAERRLRMLGEGRTDDDSIRRRVDGILREAKEGERSLRGVTERATRKSVADALQDAQLQMYRRSLAQAGREGAETGAEGEGAETELQRRIAQKAADEIAAQTGIAANELESSYGIDLAMTLLNVRRIRQENAEARRGDDGEMADTDVGEDVDVAPPEESVPTEDKIAREAEIRDLVRALTERAATETERAEAARAAREAESDDMDEDADGEARGDSAPVEGAEEAIARLALEKRLLDLENPEHFARFVAALAEEKWKRDHGIASENAYIWGDPVALQHLRMTALNVYNELAHKLMYSQRRETAMRKLRDIENSRGYLSCISAMADCGRTIAAGMVRETQEEMVSEIEMQLEQAFGAKGRFRQNEEDIHRKVTGLTELWARDVKKVLRLSENKVAEMMEEILRRKDVAEAEFAANGRSVDSSRQFQKDVRMLSALQGFGALIRRSPGEISDARLRILDRLADDTVSAEAAAREERTKQMAATLAKAFDTGKSQAYDERTFAAALSRFLAGHLDFKHLLLDLMRYCKDEDTRRQATEFVNNLQHEIQRRTDAAKTEVRHQLTEFRDAVRRIYGRDPYAVLRDLNKHDERFDRFGRGEVNEETGEATMVKMSKASAMQLYVATQQKGYIENVKANGRQGQGVELRALFSAQDLQLLKWLGDWYERARASISDVSERLFGLPVLAEEANYFPVKILLASQGLEKPSAVTWNPFPPSLTPRVRHLRDFDVRASVLDMWYQRMGEQAQWKQMAELGVELRGIFGRQSLQSTIRRCHGGHSVQGVLQFITDILNGQYRDQVARESIDIVDRVRGYAAICALGGNVAVMIRQPTSIPAFALEIGVMNTTKYLSTALTPGGLAAMRKIWDSEQRKNRWDSGNSEEVANVMRDNNPNALKRLGIKSMITNKIGDIWPTLLVGQGIFRALVRQGISEDEAMNRMWEIANRTQQTSQMDNLTAIQRRSSLGRAFFQFSSTVRQYLTYEIADARKLIAQPMNGKNWVDFCRTTVLTCGVLPALYYIVGELWKMAKGKKPDEDELMDGLVSSCVSSPWTSLFFYGLIVDGLTTTLMTGKKPWGNSATLPSLQMAENLATSLAEMGYDLVGMSYDALGGDMDDPPDMDDFLESANRFLRSMNAPYRDVTDTIKNQENN